MGRYVGPACKLCRREGVKLYLKGERCDSPKCSVSKRPYPPGKPGVVRKKMSEYAIRLREKQKARKYYGLTEEQFRNTYEKASVKKGVKGENFLQALEMRLDNIIVKMGLASSHRQARQVIRHGHFLVNAKKVDIPSYQVKVGDVVTIAEQSQPVFNVAVELIGKKTLPAWVAFDVNKREGKVLKVPERTEMDVPVNERLIVEFYSR